MTKFEFLGDLSRLIADLPQEEIEQAMEYYEDYFADAGPEKEQEIIRDFISPAYIAEQLREASLQRQKAAAQASVQEEEKQAAVRIFRILSVSLPTSRVSMPACISWQMSGAMMNL